MSKSSTGPQEEGNNKQHLVIRSNETEVSYGSNALQMCIISNHSN